MSATPMRLRSLVGLVLLVLLTGCSAGSGTTDDARPSPSSSASASPVPVTATPVPAPPRGVCHQMTWDQALAPTDESALTECTRDHTAETFAVGELKTTVDGHLLAVDASRVQRQVADLCPRRLSSYVGGSAADLRLSMLRAIWFTPTVEESDAGANWLRCDAIVVARDTTLAKVRGGLRGALDDPERRAQLSICATAEPGAPDFEQVLCRSPHTWRAVQVVDLPDGTYPGVPEVRAAGQGICEDAGRERATDTLDFQWGYEWPTADQWLAGQTFGRCWAPDPA